MGDQRSAAQEENLVGTKLAASKVEKRRLERGHGGMGAARRKQ
jgi:hypothetical protein